MEWIYVLLLLAGFICFVVAVFQNRQRRWDLVAAGLAFWILVELIIRFRAAAGV